MDYRCLYVFRTQIHHTIPLLFPFLRIRSAQRSAAKTVCAHAVYFRSCIKKRTKSPTLYPAAFLRCRPTSPLAACPVLDDRFSISFDRLEKASSDPENSVLAFAIAASNSVPDWSANCPNSETFFAAEAIRFPVNTDKAPLAISPRLDVPDWNPEVSSEVSNFNVPS